MKIDWRRLAEEAAYRCASRGAVELSITGEEVPPALETVDRSPSHLVVTQEQAQGALRKYFWDHRKDPLLKRPNTVLWGYAMEDGRLVFGLGSAVAEEVASRHERLVTHG